MVAPTLGALMSLSYRNHNGNKKVYPTDVKNSKHEMPIHIVSMNKKCAQHIIQLLVKDCPAGLKSPTLDGSLPIHLACQYSSDPTLLASLLYYVRTPHMFSRILNLMNFLHNIFLHSERLLFCVFIQKMGSSNYMGRILGNIFCTKRKLAAGLIYNDC